MSWVKRPSGLGVCVRIADSRRHEGGRKFRTAGVKVSRFAFSLSELLVAIGILGVGLLMLAAAFPVGIDQVRRAVELSTSEMVFNEAVNNLKTRVTPSELEAFFMATPTAKLGTSDIWLLDFATTPPIFQNLDNAACVYTDATSYAWQAAVQRVGSAGSRCYRFWIFVVREPSGMTVTDAGTPKLKFALKAISATPDPLNTATNRLKFVAVRPDRNTQILGDNGEMYKIVDTTPTSGIVKCDRQVHDGTTGITAAVAYPDDNPNISGTVTINRTRRAPTVAVYQTVVTY